MSHIYLNDVNLVFKTQRKKRIKDILIPGSNKFNEYEKDGSVHALKDISLEIEDGEKVAIIGHNGAGKSTFLKMLAGIYQHSSGELKVDGRISSLFEFATGFEMERTGWDNIYLRGLMLGESPREIKEKMKSIGEFSELGDFLNMPVKYYSSGMFIRLAFSVSTSIEPDILLLDEALAAGDAAFIEKANRRMNEMMENSKIMLLVTHGMDTAKQLCNRCIWLEKGNLLMDGEPDEVVRAYMSSVKGES